jgi:hypothetical protein
MRRLLVLAGLVAGVWWLVRRKRRQEPRAVIGYGDGSSLEVAADTPELDRLVATARSVIGT